MAVFDIQTKIELKKGNPKAFSFWDNKDFIKTDKTIGTSTSLKIDKQLKFVSNHLGINILKR